MICNRPSCFLPALFAMLFCLAACMPGGEAGARQNPTAAATARTGWSAELHLSGSFAGRNEELAVNDSGSFRYLNRRRGVAREGKLSPARRKKIANLLTGLPETPGPKTSGWFNRRCRDCLVFRLSWQTAGKTRSVRITSDRLARSPYHELIGVLAEIMNENPRPAGN